MPGVGDEERVRAGNEARDDDEDDDTVAEALAEVATEENAGGAGVTGKVIVDNVAGSVSVDEIAVLERRQTALLNAVMAAIVKMDASAGKVVVVVAVSRPRGPAVVWRTSTTLYTTVVVKLGISQLFVDDLED
ncbi:MAG: hypothetical protein Q9207_007427 [Kuettlingeria erythrocarpa]